MPKPVAAACDDLRVNVRAAGVRAEWDVLPAQVRAAIESHLGSPVISATNQVGGFSPGLAARVRCANGRRAFVKAAGLVLNPETPGMYRDEIRIAGALPAPTPAPRLRYSYDDGDWVVLVFDEIDGAMPEMPWRPANIRLVLDGLAELAQVLTPAPISDVPTIAEKLGDDLLGYRRLRDDPPADLDPWERRNLGRLADLASATASTMDGDTLLHVDIRADNILIGADGRAYFVDWPHASLGAPWVDMVAFGLNATLYGVDPEPLLAGQPLLAGVDPWHITALLAGLAGYFAEGSRRPAPPGLPTLREFQRVQGVAAVDWLRRRTGWE
jgi:aminoglycoside phosphotransferase (APT) family kinase protein